MKPQEKTMNATENRPVRLVADAQSIAGGFRRVLGALKLDSVAN
jgi:hypothetical protein